MSNLRLNSESILIPNPLHLQSGRLLRATKPLHGGATEKDLKADRSPMRSKNPFSTVTSSGMLLPLDLLIRIADGDANLPGLTPDAYHLRSGERLNEAASRAWTQCKAAGIRFGESWLLCLHRIRAQHSHATNGFCRCFRSWITVVCSRSQRSSLMRRLILSAIAGRNTSRFICCPQRSRSTSARQESTERPLAALTVWCRNC